MNWRKWDPTGDLIKGAGKILDKVSGAEAAGKQAEATKAAAAAGQQFIKDQALLGNEYLDEGANKASAAIEAGTEGAIDHTGTGYHTAYEDLGRGYSNALESINDQGNRLADLYNGGLGKGFQADPGYQFRLQQGLDAIEHSAAARGGRAGGDTLKALMEYGQNFASNEYNNYANRQIGLAQGADQGDWAKNKEFADTYKGLGQGQSNLSSQYGANLANLTMNQGTQLANLYSSVGSQEANNAIGVGGHSAQLGMQGVQYAGSADQARANLLAGGLGYAGGKALDWLFK